MRLPFTGRSSRCISARTERGDIAILFGSRIAVRRTRGTTTRFWAVRRLVTEEETVAVRGGCRAARSINGLGHRAAVTGLLGGLASQLLQVGQPFCFAGPAEEAPAQHFVGSQRRLTPRPQADEQAGDQRAVR